ncbi:MoxR family ATPase [Humibacillus sp. DSM 29435]|uniref:AAA family ATPase n=1 Tax=Humibacillus sp. DSM 29435 TaxID=1869167 RepID=UPI000A40446F|nr:MoxR family ATPase [Humibacillus sp. DSM 29435]
MTGIQPPRMPPAADQNHQNPEDTMEPDSAPAPDPGRLMPPDPPAATAGTQAARHTLEQALYEVKRTIVGQDELLERMMVALLARGHLLVEGVPGLAKTMAIKTLAQVVGGDFQRIQFTPDLVPADLVGTRIYNQKDGEFQVSLGPVFANLVLADEINRAPAKVQSALLEVMQERQVTIGRQTYPAPDPFLVMATQNPIESEGTYALPEAQVDRFMLKVLVGYPSAAEEFVVVERMIGALARTTQVLNADSLRGFQQQADAVYVDPAVIEYAVGLAKATRDPSSVGRPELARWLTFGASPRASINLVLAARALAFLRGRDHVLPTDVHDLSRDVLRHRIVLSYEALAEDLSPDDVLSPIIDAVPVPTRPLSERPLPAAPSTSASGGTGGWRDTTAASAWAKPRD